MLRVVDFSGVAEIIGVQKSMHIYEKSIFLITMQKFSGGFKWVLGVVYIVKFSVEAGIIICYDHMVFTPILSQMIESFAEVAYLVGFIIGVVDKGNF